MNNSTMFMVSFMLTMFIETVFKIPFDRILLVSLVTGIYTIIKTLEKTQQMED